MIRQDCSKCPHCRQTKTDIGPPSDEPDLSRPGPARVGGGVWRRFRVLLGRRGAGVAREGLAVVVVVVVAVAHIDVEVGGAGSGVA